MKTMFEDHPALQMLILAITAVTVLYLAAGVVEFLAVVNAADGIRFIEAGRRKP